MRREVTPPAPAGGEASLVDTTVEHACHHAAREVRSHNRRLDERAQEVADAPLYANEYELLGQMKSVAAHARKVAAVDAPQAARMIDELRSYAVEQAALLGLDFAAFERLWSSLTLGQTYAPSEVGPFEGRVRGKMSVPVAEQRMAGLWAAHGVDKARETRR